MKSSIRVQAKKVNNCKHQFHIKVLNQRNYNKIVNETIRFVLWMSTKRERSKAQWSLCGWLEN